MIYCVTIVSAKTFEVHASPRTCKIIQIAGPTSQLQVITLTNVILTNYCQSSRTCKCFSRQSTPCIASQGPRTGPANQSLNAFKASFFFFVSLLSHFWLIHLFYLHLLYQPYAGLCQATRVQSHQRQSKSAVAIATCEVQVSAADYQTVPTVATGVSKPLCCRLTLTFYTDQWEPIVIYHSITLTGRYTTMQPTLLTSWLQLLSYKV